MLNLRDEWKTGRSGSASPESGRGRTFSRRVRDQRFRPVEILCEAWFVLVDIEREPYAVICIPDASK